MGTLAFSMIESSIMISGEPVSRHFTNLGRVFIFMNRQSLQAQLPVGPAMNDLSGSSRVRRCIIPVSVRIINLSEELFLQ